LEISANYNAVANQPQWLTGLLGRKGVGSLLFVFFWVGKNETLKRVQGDKHYVFVSSG